MLRKFLVLFMLIPLFVHSQDEPLNHAGLQLWLRSDTGVVVNDGDKVETWLDISGNGNDAFQTVNNFRPNLVEDVLLDKPGVVFDGFNDWLDFPELTDIRTVFWVVKEDEDATISGRCLLGHDTQFDFFRGPNYNLFHIDWANAFVLEGTTKLNFSAVDATSTTVPHNFSIVSLVTTGDCRASRITLDRELFTNVWDGEFLELIIYNEPLDSAAVLSVEGYLAERYSPQFSISEDIEVEYGFCDTTICASPGFQSYLWSNGAETPCTEVNNSGSYWVEVYDSFGRLIQDTVEVNFPGTTNFDDGFLCTGEELEFDTGLDDEFYTISWNGEEGMPSLTVDSGGEVQLSVSDTLGCTLVAEPVEVVEDQFPIDATLGEDVELCAGNTITLTAEGYALSSIVWNDEFEQQIFEVIESGEYWVEATDSLGCVAQDTLFATVIGNAPQIDFDVENLCFSDATQFLNQTQSDDPIIGWHWEFGTEGQSIDQNPTHVFSAPGDYTVTLEAVSDVGCEAIFTDSVHIHQLPVADFIEGPLCSGWVGQFFDTSESPEGEIISMNWTFDGEGYEGSEIGFLLPGPGFETMELLVETEFGCTDTETRLIQILASPSVEILSDGACKEELVSFDAVIDDQGAGDVTGYYWTFGDGTVSFEPSPQHIYFFSDSYFVNVTITAENGCQGANFESLQIHEPPVADFLTENICVGQPYGLVDLSTADPDQIVEWTWVIEDYGTASGSNPIIEVDAEGFYEVELTVTTDVGCSSSITQNFPAFNPPSVAFSFEPIIQAPPADISFTNLSTGTGLSYEWDFDDGTGSDSENPSHIFEEAGTYSVTLTATSNVGCSSSVTVDILVDEPLQNLVLQNVICEETNAGTMIWVSVTNQGNFPLTEVDLYWSMLGETPSHETWAGQLQPGGVFDYQFVSGPVPGSGSDQVLCIEVDALYTMLADDTPDDNDYCKPLTNAAELTVLPPWPNPACGELTVDLMLPEAGEFTLLIHDSRGRKVVETNPMPGLEGFNRVTINVGNLLQATYYLEVRSATDAEVLGFMKK